MTPEQERTHWRLMGLPLMPEYRAWMAALRTWQSVSVEYGDEAASPLAPDRDEKYAAWMNAVQVEYPGAAWFWLSTFDLDDLAVGVKLKGQIIGVYRENLS